MQNPTCLLLQAIWRGITKFAQKKPPMIHDDPRVSVVLCASLILHHISRTTALQTIWVFSELLHLQQDLLKVGHMVSIKKRTCFLLSDVDDFRE